jgi:Na+/proline symporter
MLSAKDEKNAIGATLLFNFAHYALRPWPWIIVALASILVFPNLSDIQAQFPAINPKYLKDDIAYPAMLTLLPTGFIGLVVASLIAAYMSTIGTHLNWGSSYVVNDFYKRFVNPNATDKQQVRMGRITTVMLMVIASIFSLTFLDNATQAFDILLLSGAGTGAIYLLRWFWWRISAWTELVAMIVATIVAVVLVFGIEDGSLATEVLDHNTVRLLIAVGITTIAWIVATFAFAPTSKEVLRSFYRLTRPGGPGWKKVVEEASADGEIIEEKDAGKAWEMPIQILCVFIGAVVIYSALFAIGSFVYGDILKGVILSVVATLGTYFLFKSFGKLRAD